MMNPNKKFPRLYIDLAADYGTTADRIPLAGLQRYRREVSGPNGRYVDMVADDSGSWVWDQSRLAYIKATDY